MKAPPLEVVLGSTLIAGSSGFAIGCSRFHMDTLSQPGAAEHHVTALMIFAMLLFSILGSTAARISMTALIAAGTSIMLNSGQMGLLDGTLHSPSSKLIFILLLGILPLWTPTANSWFKRSGRVSFVHSHALRGPGPQLRPLTVTSQRNCARISTCTPPSCSAAINSSSALDDKSCGGAR